MVLRIFDDKYLEKLCKITEHSSRSSNSSVVGKNPREIMGENTPV